MKQHRFTEFWLFFDPWVNWKGCGDIMLKTDEVKSSFLYIEKKTAKLKFKQLNYKTDFDGLNSRNLPQKQRWVTYISYIKIEFSSVFIQWWFYFHF